jgi:hypothetical protein
VSHSDEGPLAISLHRTLNARILEELQTDNKQISAEEKYLFRAYSYLQLQALPGENKQQWLESVDSARKAINYIATPTPQLAVMRTFMQNWLTVKMSIGHPVSKSKFRTLVKVNLGRLTLRQL